ncbi:class I SAM-dependent methyltransferase [Pseudoxanthomonas sp. Root630]|uniref:SAM-dependent methyltransferase n=1 Tax=Pseudoxanthomonas sp. Root630 TaxID=1736574 RepID=UPI000702E609|nr:class I SAM-dependent methyltransferase [Pseudoxanthomonas sp. Root630]KRA46503.1 SAM-dependent methyltransferase [Pseudoxanthomonas sp. Root630]|eukprot:Unigene127_Nuclearia_a/m.442 Unigene127_Nuclearia_a/g.442  ORF Unigene127_Nuclearia_a/g.442 Unigene127_Nuclearia_a/m.442 type:complete len:211 (+) Unigene127_Nuclearia_a:1135-1767(+)
MTGHAFSTSDAKGWNARYDRPEHVFGTEPNAFLAAQAPRLVPGMKALAVADGEGRNGVWLAGQGLNVLSVDASEVGLAKAQRLAAGCGVHITTELADLAAWEWGHARFDVVVAIFIQFAGPALRKEMFAGMQRALKPGGLLILQGYRPEQLTYGTGGPKQIENLYDAELLRDAFAGMCILHLSAHDDVLCEGEGHQGMSALIDLVAQKDS